MNAQRQLDVQRVTDYKTLALELCDVYAPSSKTAIADHIGISQKTIYNMIYGEPVGVYTQKKLIAFLQKEFGYQIKTLKNGISLKKVEGVNISSNTINKSNVAGRDVIGDNKQLDFYRSYIELMTEENLRLRLEIEKLKTK